MFLEMLLLNKPEEVLSHSFRCVSAQYHVVGICLVAIVLFFQTLLLFCGVLCSIAYGLALVIRLSGAICIITYGSGCVSCLCDVVTNAPGVLCGITDACDVLCRITSSIALIS